MVYNPAMNPDPDPVPDTDPVSPDHDPPSDHDLQESATSFVNHLTMEFMVNKRFYKKCLQQTNVPKFEERALQFQELKKRKDAFMEMTHELLEDFIRYYDCDKFTGKVNAAFEEYVSACLEHMHRAEETDSDTLFDPAHMTPAPAPAPALVHPFASVFGKSITKTG